MLTADRNKILSNKFTLGILTDEASFNCIESFSCGDNDLDEFFQKDAFGHTKQLLAQTYYFQPNEITQAGLIAPIALVSFLNDSIQVRRNDHKGIKGFIAEYIETVIPSPKSKYSSFPAVKIGRLATHKDYQCGGVGTVLLNMVKEFFLINNRTGCRFLTVDAYNKPDTIHFYNLT